ncbi:MAG: TlpA family protein disulfide reductase [Solirubrobacterales bacterium]
MAGKIAIFVLVAGVLAAAAFALLGGEQKPPAQHRYTSLAQVKPDVSNADPRLQRIVAQSGQLLPGGRAAYRKRIASLKGLPIVVNKWGSWCSPCRREFPSFQETAKMHGDVVAFIGVDWTDSADDAGKFLRQFPVPYPSYTDSKLEIAPLLGHAGFAPITGFYNPQGKLVHVHAGPYDTATELEIDIEKYAR